MSCVSHLDDIVNSVFWFQIFQWAFVWTYVVMFVGIEIKPGKPTKVEQEDGYLIHVSQVCYQIII